MIGMPAKNSTRRPLEKPTIRSWPMKKPPMSKSTWMVRPIDWAITKFHPSVRQGSTRFANAQKINVSTAAIAVLKRIVQKNCNQIGPDGRAENSHQLRHDWRSTATFDISGPVAGCEL